MSRKQKGLLINTLVAVLIPAILLLITYIAVPERVNGDAIYALLMQACSSAILGWGLIFQIKANTMDLSVGAVYLVSAIIGGNLALQMGWGVVGVAVLIILVGMAAGAVTGLVFYLFKIPSFIVSLAMLLIYESFSASLFRGNGLVLPKEMIIMSKLPWSILVPVVTFIISYFLYNKTSIGVHAKAIGQNTSVAEMNGISLFKTKITCFVITGAFAGVYAFVQAGKVGIITGVQGMGSLSVAFDAMMCAFLAVALGIYLNEIICIYISALILQILKYALLMLGLDATYQTIAVGIFVLIVLGIMTNKARMQLWFNRQKARIRYKAENKTKVEQQV